MGEASDTTRRQRALALLLVAFLGAGLFAATRPGREPAEAPADAAPVAATEPAASAPEPAEAPTPAPEVQTRAEAPAFDVVRVAPDGAAVVAGTAEPGARVTVTADAGALAEVEADDAGNFVAIFRAEPSVEPRALGLTAETDDGTRTNSDDVVVLLPNAPAEEDPASTGDATPDEAPEIAATAILRGEDVEFMPADGRGEPRQVTLGSISYAAEGEVTLAGLGTAGAQVRAYVDDDLAEAARVGADGRWSLQLGDVEEGLYRLRVDLLDPDGRVESRVETPFQRDFPAAPLPRPGAGGPGELLTVQPGTNLWTIARTHYGSGVLYTMIYTANRSLIRDPDLIYPGQVLAMPEHQDESPGAWRPRPR